MRVEDGDRGFTLIELMVVVLIIAILLAIAIPTFLGARQSANARAVESALRNALTAEISYFSGTDQFTTDTTTAGMAGIEPVFLWVTGTAATASSSRAVIAVATGDANQVVELQAMGNDGNCYALMRSNDPSNSFEGYNVTAGVCSTPSVPSTLPTIASGLASANRGSGWYSSW